MCMTCTLNGPEMESSINDIPGVVCNGLFALAPADSILLATPDEIIEID